MISVKWWRTVCCTLWTNYCRKHRGVYLHIHHLHELRFFLPRQMRPNQVLHSLRRNIVQHLTDRLQSWNSSDAFHFSPPKNKKTHPAEMNRTHTRTEHFSDTAYLSLWVTGSLFLSGSQKEENFLFTYAETRLPSSLPSPALSHAAPSLAQLYSLLAPAGTYT